LAIAFSTFSLTAERLKLAPGCMGGKSIAEYSDYALAQQLIGDSFRESLAEGHRYTDDRIRLIEKTGPITPRALSEKTGVSTAAISQWLKALIEKGVLSWCDEKGLVFTDVAELKKAKRSGRAYLKVSNKYSLPTVFELTGDASWDEGWEFWELYNLGFEKSNRHGDESTVLPEIETDDFIGEKSVPLDADGAVKVLSEKTGPDNNFKNERLDSELVPVSIDGLSEELRDLLQMN
jgi:hypothetical protein